MTTRGSHHDADAAITAPEPYQKAPLYLTYCKRYLEL